MPNLTDVGILVLRLAVGLTFAAHGAQKILGWFGGRGMAAHAAFLEAMGIRPARPLAWINAAGELFGGLGLAAGLLTSVAAAGPLGSMMVAVLCVHWRKGFWNHEGGLEYPLLLAVLSFVIGLIGPGRYSLDAAFGIRLPEPWTYIVVLAATAAVTAWAATRHARQPPSSQA